MTCLMGQAKYSAFTSAIIIEFAARTVPLDLGRLLPSGRKKPNAIELARIAEVQPVLAEFTQQR